MNLCEFLCDGSLPAVKFSDCAPQVRESEIRRIFIASRNAEAFTDWQEPTEWTERISSSGETNDAIRAFTVIADKPAAESNTIELSDRRQFTTSKNHTVNFTIDDVSEENYNFLQDAECQNQFRAWYETHGGILYGGNEGVKCSFVGNNVLNRGLDEIELIEGTLTWRGKSPDRTESPIADIDFSIDSEEEVTP